MIGRLFRLLAGASVLLLLAVGVLWVRNHWAGDQLQMDIGSHRSARGFAIRTVDGRIRLLYSRLLTPIQGVDSGQAGSAFWPIEFTYSPVPKGSLAFDDSPIGNVSTIANLETAGFVVRKQDWGRPPAPVFRSWELRVPSWFALAVLAVLPTLAMVASCRKRCRARNKRCPQCGYDVRASTGRCPECGTGLTMVERPT